MANQYVNKVVIGGETKIDLTGDTVTTSTLLSGTTAHDKSGAPITGTCAFDCDTSTASAAVAEVLASKTFGATGQLRTGTMPNRGGSGGGSISTKAGTHTIAQGYHDGSAKVKIDDTEQAKIIPGNIKQGVVILGVTGTCEPSSDITATSRTAEPTFSQQTILPPSGYDYLSQVIVEPIPMTEADNTQGGVTLTIGTNIDQSI